MTKFDQILVVAGEDLIGLKEVILNSNKFLQPNKIFIIAPKDDITKYGKFYQDIHNVVMVIESDILDIDSIAWDNFNLPEMSQRKFWYYQQFLKMSFSYSTHLESDHYLIWDADTLPIREMLFFENNSTSLTVSENEYHQEYFDNIHKIFDNEIKLYSKSFISQHLMVTKEHMLDMLQQISSDNYCDILLSKLSGKTGSLFSEYETYANYVLNNYAGMYTIKSRPWYRKGGYLVDNIKGLNKYSSRYEYMAFEKHDFHKSKLSKLSVRVKFFVRNLISMRIM
jgi:hypothetical protein